MRCHPCSVQARRVLQLVLPVLPLYLPSVQRQVQLEPLQVMRPALRLQTSMR